MKNKFSAGKIRILLFVIVCVVFLFSVFRPNYLKSLILQYIVPNPKPLTMEDAFFSKLAEAGLSIDFISTDDGRKGSVTEYQPLFDYLKALPVIAINQKKWLTEAEISSQFDKDWASQYLSITLLSKDTAIALITINDAHNISISDFKSIVFDDKNYSGPNPQFFAPDGIDISYLLPLSSH